jgi:hypothetical protein
LITEKNRQKNLKTDKKPTKKPTKNRENRQMSVFKIIEFQKPTNVGSKYFVSVAILAPLVSFWQNLGLVKSFPFSFLENR